MSQSPTLEGANLYHLNRLGKEAWEAQSEDRRQRALQSAVDSLGAFARSGNYETAVYEQALWLLNDEAELAALGVTSIGLDGMSKGYQRGRRPAHIAPNAWILVSGVGGGVKCGSIRSERPWRCSRVF